MGVYSQRNGRPELLMTQRTSISFFLVETHCQLGAAVLHVPSVLQAFLSIFGFSF